MRLACPHLGGEVEWTEERQAHIAARHPELLPAHLGKVTLTIADPDEIRRDHEYPNTRLLFRWFDDLMGGKNVVVATVSTPPPNVRHWIVTAFVARKQPKGELEWKRP